MKKTGKNIKIKSVNLEKSALKSIKKRIASGIEPGDLTEFLFDELRKIIPLDRLDFGFTEDDNQRIALYSTKTGYPGPLLEKDTVIEVIGSIFQEPVNSRNPVIINDLKKTMKIPGGGPVSLLVKEGIKSYMILPIIIEGGTSGVMCAGSKKADQYGESEGKFIRSALHSIQLVVEKIHRLVQAEKTTRIYMDMLGMVSHEIKSPLASIITMGKTLAEGYFGKMEDKQRENIEKMVKQAEYLHDLSSNYLSLARFESGEFKLNPRLIDFLDEIIEPAIDVMKPLIDERRMKLKKNFAENIYPVTCDPDLIKTVFLNLLGNAVKYGNPGGEIKVTMKYAFKRLRVSVWNEGPGFTEADRKRLFRKFSRLQSEDLAGKKGTGVGLYVSWKIVRLHGGIIGAESEKTKWAEFYFDLPRYMDMSIIK